MLSVIFLVFSCKNGEESRTLKRQELPDVEVSADVDKVEAVIGDKILYSINISSVPGIKVNVEELGEDIAGFKVVDWHGEGPKEVDDRIKMSRVYKLRADAVGSYIIPSVKVTYLDESGGENEINTEEIYVQIKSAIGADEEFKDIIDIKPLVDVKAGYSTVIIIIAALILLIAGAAICMIYLKKRKKEKIAPPVSAHETAFKELDELKSSDLLKEKKVKTFHFRLSEIFRGYLEARLSFNASEWTTEEILPVLENKVCLDRVLKDLVRNLLRNTDIVKFTDFVPEDKETLLELSRAYRFVEQTIQKDEVS
jgi:hypothetical protein